MEDSLINDIDEIYSSYDIYKAFFITKKEDLNHLYQILNKMDYPICKNDKLNDFNDNKYRILLIDIDFYENNKTLININNITTIIYINVFDKIDDLSNIDDFFL